MAPSVTRPKIQRGARLRLPTGDESLRDKKVVIGVGGGIACYRACDLVRAFVKAGANVRVAMTVAATRFVSPLTFQALSGHPALVDLLDAAQDRTYGHLELARQADLLVVAPATADLIARLRLGLGDDAVATTALAVTCPVLIAPAMNSRMWESPPVREHVAALQARGWAQVGPDEGLLADGDTGPGRLAQPEAILAAARQLLRPKDWVGKKVVVTAGPTREFFDPVRFLSNPSTGKMGYALARAAAARGAEVVLVSGPSDLPAPWGMRLVRVESAEEMSQAVDKAVAGAVLFIGAAAVSDYKPDRRTQQKIKKSDEDLPLKLIRTPDILARLGHRRGKKRLPILVGFAAETEKLVVNARLKLRSKGCDLVVANLVGEADSGFAVDQNQVTLVSASQTLLKLSGSKEQIAQEILEQLSKIL